MLQCLLWFGLNRFEFTSRVRCHLDSVCQLVNSMKTDVLCVVVFPSNSVVTGFPAEQDTKIETQEILWGN